MDIKTVRALHVALNLDADDHKALDRAYVIFDKLRNVMRENELDYLATRDDDTGEGLWDSDLDTACKVADMLTTNSEWEA